MNDGIRTLDSVFDFGKHRGEILRDVCVDDREYVEWCLNTISIFRITEEAKAFLDECAYPVRDFIYYPSKKKRFHSMGISFNEAHGRFD
jgi:hypothetical protein